MGFPPKCAKTFFTAGSDDPWENLVLFPAAANIKANVLCSESDILQFVYFVHFGAPRLKRKRKSNQPKVF
jgi:hypothetical protein